MASRLYHKPLRVECWVTLLAERNTRLSPIPDPPAPIPLARVGPGGIAISARCFDAGLVDMDIWAGDPGAPLNGWFVVFDGQLEVGADGLSAGTAYYPVYRIAVPPGLCHVRAEARHDPNGDIDAVRLIFPKDSELTGSVLFTPPEE
jgi:hypothetical protein